MHPVGRDAGSRRVGFGSVIIHDFTVKSTFFMSLGACRLKKRVLMGVAVWCAGLNIVSCGGGSTKSTHSGLPHRVLASQSVSTGAIFSGLVIINGDNDTLPRIAPISSGSSPGIMAISPSRNIVATFDSGTNAVFAVDTTKESPIGGVRLPAPSSSVVVPTSNATGFAAVPGATVNGFAFLGAIEVLNFSTNSFTTIAVNNAQTVVSSSTGTQLLVFSPDVDTFTVLFPGAAIPPIDTTCYTNPNQNPPNACTIVTDSRLSRPVNAILNGTTAYILNCGSQCGGSQPPSVAVFDMGSLTITRTVAVDGATMALLNSTTLYVAGTPKPPVPCPASQNTTAKTCGMLDIVDLNSMQVTSSTAITDGYHDRMDLTTSGQVFIGSHDCTNIGNVNNPGNSEVRGCLSIYRTADGSVVFPPDNGDVTGLQGFTTRDVEYVVENGELRVYDTTKDILLINDFVPQGTIDVIGQTGDVKAIDFF